MVIVLLCSIRCWGRIPVLSGGFIPIVEEYLAERLTGREITSFREMAGESIRCQDL